MEELLLETIGSYNEYIGNIPAGAENVTNLLREDKIEEASQEIKNFSEGLLWLIEVKNVLTKIDIKVDLQIEKIQEILEEINEGLVKGDFVLVADMFEYEVAPFFASVNKITEVLQ